MKLIIDIPEEVKNRLCFGVTYTEDIQAVCEALHNGVPLEDIKAEIIEMQERNDRKAEKDKEIEQWLFHVNQGLEVALLIIDRHIGDKE